MFKSLSDAVEHYLTAGFLTVSISALNRSFMMVGKAGEVIIVAENEGNVQTVTLN